MIILSFRNPQKTYITVRLGARKKHKVYARGCIKLLRPHKINTYYYTGSAYIRFLFTRQALFTNDRARFYERVSEK